MNDNDIDVLKKRYSFYKRAKGVKGDVCEVGLGWGFLADDVLDRDDVASLDSYELSPQMVADYKSKGRNKGNRKHTIVEKDFTVDNGKKKYDVLVIDVFDEMKEEVFNNAKAIVNKAKTRVKKGGKIMVEYQSDVPLERDFRQFMSDNFGEPEYELIYGEDSIRNSRYVCYYNV